MSRLTKYVFLAFLLAGCEPAVNPDQIQGPACQSEVCWDLSNVSALKVNDFPVPDRLVSKEAHGWRFPTIVGHTYTVKVRVTSGYAHTYVSSDVIIDPINNPMTDYYSNDGVVFAAVASEYYIAVEDTGNVRGSDYTVRIASYDENLDPLPDTTVLLINDELKTFKLVQSEIIRFMFNGIRGVDYAVKVRVSRGGTHTFLSLIPSVDDAVYDIVGSYSGDLAFRATETSNYYIAVIDSGTITGSDFTIQVTSP